MRVKVSRYILFYGLFVVLYGLAEYFSSGTHSIMTLVIYGVMGNLMLVWGRLIRGGFRFAELGGLLTVLFMTGAFGGIVRSQLSKALNGRSEGMKELLLPVLPFAVSIVLLIVIYNFWNSQRQHNNKA